MDETFICALCGGEFLPGDSDEALKELEENFPGTSTDDCRQVCDDCYDKALLQIFGKENKSGNSG